MDDSRSPPGSGFDRKVQWVSSFVSRHQPIGLLWGNFCRPETAECRIRIGTFLFWRDAKHSRKEKDENGGGKEKATLTHKRRVEGVVYRTVQISVVTCRGRAGS